MPANFLKKIGLSAASLLVTLIALEIALRSGGYNPLGEMRAREFAMRLSVYPDLKYELTPGHQVDVGAPSLRLIRKASAGLSLPAILQPVA